MKKPRRLRTLFLSARGLLTIVSLLAVSYLAVLYYTRYRDPVVVTWSTVSELDTAGFNVLRGTDREGPFIRLNQELIPACPDPLQGGEYSYRDSDQGSAQTSYYLLQIVSNNGDTRDLQVIEVRSGNGSAKKTLLAGAAVGLTLIILFGRSILNRTRAVPHQTTG